MCNDTLLKLSPKTTQHNTNKHDIAAPCTPHLVDSNKERKLIITYLKVFHFCGKLGIFVGILRPGGSSAVESETTTSPGSGRGRFVQHGSSKRITGRGVGINMFTIFQAKNGFLVSTTIGGLGHSGGTARPLCCCKVPRTIMVRVVTYRR